MKHSVAELVDIAYQYFPRGMQGDEPGYNQTPEARRRIEARVGASARFGEWVGMLRRLEQRFAAFQAPELIVHNGSHFLASPGASHLDRCFTGAVSLPVRADWEEVHKVQFLVSFVVPYYTVYSISFPRVAKPEGGLEPGPQISFDFSPDEVPFVKAIEEEVSRTFPGHEPMPPEVGKTIVPDVIGGGNLYGESTIYGCLFSDDW